MKKLARIITLTLIVLTINQIKAQDINSIREKYNGVKEYISLQNKEIHYKNDGELTFSHNVPGTGPQTYNCKFYFTPYKFNENGEILPHTLQFVQCRFNIAARDYYEEYLYDEVGNLIFAYGKEPSLDDSNKSHEIRLYLNNKELIKVMSDYTNNNQDNNSYQQELLTRATYFTNIFSSINKFGKNE